MSEKNEGGEKRARVTDEQFVEVWTEAALSEGTVADVAEKLGLKKESVSVRATTLRKALREQADVELPKMQRRVRGSKKDFGKLAEIIRQMDLEGVDTVGHSLGGMATLIADSIQPGIIGRSVIIESRVGPRPASAPSQDLQERAKRAAMKRSIWENRETMYEAYRNRPVFKNWTDEVFGDFIQGGTRLLPDGRAELKCKPAVEASFYGQRDGVNDAVYIERLKGQYLLLLGDYPAGQKLEDVGVKDFLKVVPGSQVKAMGCGSHFLPMEYPDLVLGEIKGFFGS